VVTDLIKEEERYEMKCVKCKQSNGKILQQLKCPKQQFFSGKCEPNCQLGNGFGVHESIIHSVREFRNINPRISILTLKLDNMDEVHINIHAPINEKDEEEK